MTQEQAEWYQKGIESIASRCPYCGLSLARSKDGKGWLRTCGGKDCLDKQRTNAGRKSAAAGGNRRKW